MGLPTTNDMNQIVVKLNSYTTTEQSKSPHASSDKLKPGAAQVKSNQNVSVHYSSLDHQITWRHVQPRNCNKWGPCWWWWHAVLPVNSVVTLIHCSLKPTGHPLTLSFVCPDVFFKFLFPFFYLLLVLLWIMIIEVMLFGGVNQELKQENLKKGPWLAVRGQKILHIMLVNYYKDSSL